MKQHKYMLLLVAALVMMVATNCQAPVPDDDPANKDTEVDPSTLERINASVPVTSNWIFEDKPSITIHMENPNAVDMTAAVRIQFITDLKQTVEIVEQTYVVPANGKKDVTLSTSDNLDPGFYRAFCYVNNKSARGFVFGISPTQMKVTPDMQEDFDQFWDQARNQLPTLDQNTVTLTEIPSRSNSYCKVYLVEMQSVPDGPSGDPVTIRGYYLEPQDGKKHPVIMHFYGYDTQNNPSKLSCPSGYGEYAEFYLSHRGQYINNRKANNREDGIDRDFTNIYGDWFAFNFGKKDSYYYRGAFMDCVQAVRFMATRQSSDMNNLFAEGSSQGGALSYAAAALSDYPFTAIAPNVAFLGDFPNYFNIVSWPGDVAKKNKGTMTDEEMYAFLSYFDTKNLATKISCAVYATSGLQDGTCPPRTNTAPFVNLKSTDKEMHYYPEMQHSYPANWTNDIMQFFKNRIK